MDNHKACLSHLLVGSLLFTSVSVQAEIHFRLLEKGSGDPVADATIVLMNSEAFTRSNPQGQAYFADARLPQKVKVLAPGYETLELTTARPDLYLVPLAVQGQERVVTAARIPQKASKHMLDKQALRKIPGTQGDPLKSVSALPGVVTAGEQGTQMYVRGSSAGQNTVWINRFQVPYLYHFDSRSVINPALLDDFNIFLGGFPVEYPNKLGGVLDVKLRAPRTDRLRQHYKLAINESAVLVEGPLKMGEHTDGALFAARRSYVDLIMDEEQFSDLIGFDESEITTIPVYHDMQAMWQRQLKRGSLNAMYINSNDKIAFINREDQLTDPEALGKLDVDVGYHVGGLNWQQAWSAHWDSLVTTYVTRTNERQQVGQSPDGEPYHVYTDSTQMTLHPELRWRKDNQQTWSFGSQASYTTYDIDLYISQPPSEEQIDFNLTEEEKYRVDTRIKAAFASPYIKQQYKWNDRLTSIAGLRASKILASGDIELFDVSPRLTLEYQLTPKTLLTGSWGRYVQMPDGHKLLQDFGNPRLEYEQAEHRIVGVQYQHDEVWSVLLEGYHKPMRRLAISVAGETPPDNFQNEGSAEAYGIDLLIKRESRNRKMGWLSYSYAKATRTNDITGETRDFIGDQPHTLTLLWGQPLPGSWNKWDWSIKMEVRSGQPYTRVKGRQSMCVENDQYVSCESLGADASDARFRYWRPLYGGHNDERLPAYFRVDMRFERPVLFNTWKMTTFIDLQNVTFHRNVVGYDYGDAYNRVDNPREITGLPFFPFFGIEAEF